MSNQKYVFYNCLYTLENEEHKIKHLLSFRVKAEQSPQTTFESEGIYYTILDERVDQFITSIEKRHNSSCDVITCIASEKQLKSPGFMDVLDKMYNNDKATHELQIVSKN
jgi:Mg2+ and Co2+ transporter CorA